MNCFMKGDSPVTEVQVQIMSLRFKAISRSLWFKSESSRMSRVLGVKSDLNLESLQFEPELNLSLNICILSPVTILRGLSPI